MQANSDMLIKILQHYLFENNNVQANPSLLAHYDIKNADDYLKNIQI
jgi:hypothetical protein